MNDPTQYTVEFEKSLRELAEDHADQIRFLELEHQDQMKALANVMKEQDELLTQLRSVETYRSQLEGYRAELKKESDRLETVLQNMTEKKQAEKKSWIVVEPQCACETTTKCVESSDGEPSKKRMSH